MLRPHHLVLLVSLLGDGGTVAPRSEHPAPEARTTGAPTSTLAPDAGTAVAPASPPASDAGTVARKPVIIDGFRWPEDDELQLLTLLDGRAIVAAHAATQDLMARFAQGNKKYAKHCDHSPKAMDVVIFEGKDLYVVSIKRRLDRCGGFDPSFNDAFPPEIYAVSPEGRILARYPHPY